MPKKIISLQDVRLASTSGHIILVPARKPTRIPDALYLEAAKNGCIDYDPKLAKAFVEAMAAAATEADEEAVFDPTALIRESVRKVMIFGDKQALTKDGIPKVAAVKSALEILLAEEEISVDVAVDREIVYDMFVELQDAVANEKAASELVAASQHGGDLEGEEAGGDVDAMLERVEAVEE